MRAPLVVLVALSLSACGDCRRSGRSEAPPSKAAAPAAETVGARFRAALGKARGFEVKASWDEAIAAYREALALYPDAPRTLDSLARSQLGKGDLDGALATLDDALARAPDPKAIATALYTRARVLDAKGDAAGATRAVRASHDLLPREESRAVLGKKLGRDGMGVLSAIALDGPLGELGELCKARAPTPRPADWTCDPEKGNAEAGPNLVEPASGPFTQARLIELGTPAAKDCVLAVQAGGKWWTLDVRQRCRTAHTSLTSKDLAVVVARTGGEPHLFVRLITSGQWKEIDPDGNEVEIDDSDTFVILCGVGPSKIPSCTPHAPEASRRTLAKQGVSQVFEYTLTHGRGDGGSLDLSHPAPEQLDKPLRALLGSHPMMWP